MSDNNKNLLFGHLAVMLRGIAPDRMRDIVAQWAADPTRDLPDRLIEANLLAPEEKSLIESFMNEALRARNGDIDRVIESLGGRQFVEASLHSLSAGPREPGSQDVTVKGPQPVYLDERRDKAPGVEETPGRYTGESEYARGGMGRVLLVHDEHLGREVAMKELLPASARQRPPQTPVGQGLEMVSRFLREARVTGQLEHPSIVPVYELGRRRDGTIYYTMKLVRGKTLGDTIRDAKTLQGRMGYLTNFIDLCQAIAYAHSRGVIHRDIKPGNVMIGEFGETVVLDWGLAKSNKERDPELDKMEETLRQLRLGTTLEQKDTTHGHVLGTPTYMPPEQASGQLSEVDERSDVYSLGAVLYELLAGARPFIGSSVGDILNKVIDQEPKPITLYEPDAPPELIAICKKAMSKISKDRYATARELAAEIENFLSGALVGAYQYSLKEQLRRWMRRNKSLVATSALATAAIIVITAGYLISLNQKNAELVIARNNERDQRILADESRERAERKTYVSQTRLINELVEHRNFNAANELLWNTDPTRRGWEWGFLLNRCNQDLFTINECPLAIFSPDGTHIATLSREAPAKLWNASDGSLIRTYAPIRTRLLSLAFSPDGKRLAAGGFNGRAYIWNVNSSDQPVSAASKPGYTNNVAFTPDGTGVILASNSGACYRINALTGADEAEVNLDSTEVTQLSFSQDGSALLAMSQVGRVHLMDANTLQPRWSIAGRLPRIDEIGKRVLISRETQALFVKLENGEQVGLPLNHRTPVSALEIDSSGMYVVTAGADGIARLWDAETSNQLAELSHGEPIRHATFSPSGDVLATLSARGLIKTWGLPAARLLGTYEGHSADVGSLRFSANGETFLTSSLDSTTKVWSASGSLSSEHRASFNVGVDAADMNAAGRTAVVLENGQAILYSSADLHEALLDVLVPCAKFKRSVVISPRGDAIALAADSFTPMVIDVASGEVRSLLVGHTGAAQSLAYNYDGTLIVSGATDGTVRIWDAATGSEIKVLRGHSDFVRSVAVSPDGKRIASGGNDNTIRLWDTDSGAEVRKLEGHTNAVISVRYSFDGATLISTSSDGTSRIWDANAAHLRTTLAGHRGGVIRASLMPDENRMLTTYSDGGMSVWDVALAEELTYTKAHGTSVTGVFPLMDPNVVLTFSLDKSAKTWKAAPFWGPKFVQSTKADILAQFAQYKREISTKKPDAGQAASVAAMSVVVTAAALERGLRAIAEIAQAQVGSESNGITIPAQAHPAIAFLGFLDGDRIQKLNGGSINQPGEFSSGVDAVLKDLTSKKTEIVLLRGGSERVMRFHIVEPLVHSQQIEVLRDDLIKSLMEFSGTLAAGTNTVDDLRVTTAMSLGEISRSTDPIRGVWLNTWETDSTAPPDPGLPDSVIGDRLLAIDGEVIDSTAELVEMVKRMLEGVRNGSVSKVRLDTTRGQFQYLNSIISLTS